jgi:hypothetical protein
VRVAQPNFNRRGRRQREQYTNEAEQLRPGHDGEDDRDRM